MLKRRSWTKRSVFMGLAIGAVLLAGARPGRGDARPLQATAPSLGTAASFAVLAASTVTNIDGTVVNGNLGVWPNNAPNAITGFPPGIVIGGTIHPGDAVAQQAQSDVTTSYNALAGQSCDTNLTGQDLGGLTLTAGTYCFSSSAQLTGTLTLNAQGNPDAVFVFQIGSTLTTASASAVRMINGGSPCNVFWQLGSSATLGTDTSFLGNILALASITLTTRVSVIGRALARNGAVTMDTNVVSREQCRTISQSTSTPVPPTQIPPATATAIAAATNTAIAAPTSTAIAAATNTAVAAPTATAIAAATNTAIVAATSTAIAAATRTAVVAATSTAIIAATSTAVAAPTSTAIAAATSTAIAAATNTAIAAPTATAIAAATNTAIVAATSTATAASTPTAVAHAKSTATTITVATATTVTHVRTPPTVPIPTMVPNTGAGGTYIYTSPNETTLGHAAAIRGNNSVSVKSPVALPRTGGGAGSGNHPSSPFAPLALLCMIAIGAGRLTWNRLRRS
jgi:Ice-binding-like